MCSVEINSAINLLQDVPFAEQAIDLTENGEQSLELDFEKLLAEANATETVPLQNTCNLPPVAGNELPLVIESKSKDTTFLDMLEKAETEVEVVTEIEEAKQVELPFLMTQLLIDIPNDPIVISENTLDMMPTMIQPNDATKASIQLLSEPLLQDQLIGLPVDSESLSSSEQESDFKVMLKDAPTIEKQDRALNLLSDVIKTPQKTDNQFDEMQPVLKEAAIAEPKVVEFANALSEIKPKDDNVTLDKPHLTVNEFYVTKETVKTMVLPANQPHDEQFTNLFEQKLMDNVSVMVRRNENVAQIQIDPPELGKIEITIAQNDDKTDIRFVAQVDQTKQLIENTMDRLKVQFEQSGLMLGQVDVNAGNQGQHSFDRSFVSSQNIVSQEDDVIAPQQIVNLQNNQLLDLYI